MKNHEYRGMGIGTVTIGIAVFACLLLSAPAASAYYNLDGWPVVTRTNGTLNGTVFFDSEPWHSTKSLILNSDVPDGTVKWARLYTGIWGGNPESTYWHNVTFNENELGPIHLKGETDTNPNVWVSGSGKHWWWYNVTTLTNAGETNTAHTWYINGTGMKDGRVYGIALVVVLENESMPTIQYWVNDGSDGLNYNTPHDAGTTSFDGTVDIANVTNANLTMVHLTADIHTCDDCLRFNNNILDTSMIDSDTFEINTWDVTYYVNSSGNNAWYSRGEDGYVSVTNTILVLKYGTTPPSVTDAVASPAIIPEDTDNEPQWGENSTLNVTVRDNSNITVTINLSAIGGSANQPMKNIEGSDVWSVTANASIGTAGWNVTTNAYEPYSLQVNATDELGYSNTNVSLNLTVMNNGDVDEDGNANDSDAMYIFRWWLHKPGFEQINKEAADVSGDGVVTAYDALYLFKWYLNRPGFGVLK